MLSFISGNMNILCFVQAADALGDGLPIKENKTDNNAGVRVNVAL